MPTNCTAKPDMKSPATSNRHLSKFGKWPKIPLPTVLTQILVVRRFACSTSWWASCLSKGIILGKTPNSVFALCHVTMFVVQHKERQSYISRTVCPRINKFYVDIYTGLLYIHNGYDATNCFQSDFIVKKHQKCNLG